LTQKWTTAKPNFLSFVLFNESIDNQMPIIYTVWQVYMIGILNIATKNIEGIPG